MKKHEDNAARERYNRLNYSQQRRHCYVEIGRQVRADRRGQGIFVRTLTQIAMPNSWDGAGTGNRERARRATRPGTPERAAAYAAARQGASA